MAMIPFLGTTSAGGASTGNFTYTTDSTTATTSIGACTSGTTSTQVTLTTNIPTNVGVLIVPLTDDEKNKLYELRQERDSWLKQEKLKKFQDLPSHIRQDIVDEALLRFLMDSMCEIDNATGFYGQKELADLESRDNYPMWATDSGNSWHGAGGNNFKYGHIINQFTKEELIEAHASATVEESLEEENTDGS